MLMALVPPVTSQASSLLEIYQQALQSDPQIHEAEARREELIDAASMFSDELMEAALEAGADDVRSDSDHFEVLTDPAEFESVRNQMIAAGHEPETAELTMRASTSSSLDVKEASSMVKMLEVLEDLDDVQQVYSNADISEDVLAQL